MRVNAWVGSGRATITRDGTPLLSGRDLTKDLKAGDYTLVYSHDSGQGSPVGLINSEDIVPVEGNMPS